MATYGAATAIGDVIKALTPRNFSLGMKNFRIRFTYNTICNSLPLNLSYIVLGNTKSFYRNQLDNLEALKGILLKATQGHI